MAAVLGTDFTAPPVKTDTPPSSPALCSSPCSDPLGPSGEAGDGGEGVEGVDGAKADFNECPPTTRVGEEEEEEEEEEEDALLLSLSLPPLPPPPHVPDLTGDGLSAEAKDELRQMGKKKEDEDEDKDEDEEEKRRQ